MSSTREDAADASRRGMDKLANVKPSTPVRRASSAGPSSMRTTRRTPANQARTPGGQRLGSARRPLAVTPHGRAAQRELNQRRGLTPGKDRRRSGRQQRETPRDILRALSRKLAPKSERIVYTPEGQKKDEHKDQEDDFEDGPALPRPRFSLPLGDEDDDDSLIEPPKSAGLEDEEFTARSVELPRRAISEQPLGRFSRGSFGSVRLSDVFADLNDVGGDNYDSSYLAGGGFGNNDDPMDDDAELQGENTATLRGFELGRGRLSFVSGRESDIWPGAFRGDDNTTEFVFNVPQRDASEELPAEDELDDLIQQQIFDESQDHDNNPEEQDNVEDVHPKDIEDVDESDVDEVEDRVLNLQADTSMQDTTTMTELEIVAAQKRRSARKKVKLSKHGIQYPSLPAGVVKKLAMAFARTAGNSKAKISKETLDAIMQATDWFFEQVSDDLGAYAKHAGRKTIDESDIITLMARQRQTSATVTPFSLAQRHLPRELVQELRMAPPSKLNRGRRLETVAEEKED